MKKGYNIKTALIITTYNWPEALGLVLESVKCQTVAPDEILVADDGSSKKVRNLVDSWSSEKSSLVHVWQPDCAFRAGRIRNLAILKTEAEHLVFIDGDCLLPPTFIENQRAMIKPNTLVSGGRYLSNSMETHLLLSGSVGVTTSLFDDIKFVKFPLGWLRDIQPKNANIVRSCNFALARNDLVHVGGFDESYVGWGREDTDLVQRLLNAGLAVRSGRFGGSVYHLHHPVSDRSYLDGNQIKLERVLSDSAIIAPTKSSVYEL